MVLIDRGFVPDVCGIRDTRRKESLTVRSTSPAWCASRKPKALFIPDNEPEANRWFWRDLAGHDAFDVPRRRAGVAPFFLEAEKSDMPGGWPEGGQTRLELPNNHLQYAITWFLLAGALVVIYVVYVRGAIAGGYPKAKPLRSCCGVAWATARVSPKTPIF